MKSPEMLLAIPAAFIFTLVVATLFSLKAKGGNFLTALGSGFMVAGVVTAVVEFVVLLPLLTKGTDGPGGLICIILPVFTFIVCLGISTVLLAVGGMAKAVKAGKKQDQSMSPEALAILNGSKDFIHAPPVITGQGTWRDFALSAPKR